jgi:hypothetical protein
MLTQTDPISDGTNFSSSNTVETKGEPGWSDEILQDSKTPDKARGIVIYFAPVVWCQKVDLGANGRLSMLSGIQ